MVGTSWLHDLGSVQRLWAQEVRSRKGGATERTGLCLVCGECRPLLTTIPEPVKKGAVPTSGGSNEGQLISINAAAQGRQGLTQLVNTPVCHQCGGRVMAVLNHLLASDRHRRRFRDDGVRLWWTRQTAPDSALAISSTTSRKPPTSSTSVTRWTSPPGLLLRSGLTRTPSTACPSDLTTPVSSSGTGSTSPFRRRRRTSPPGMPTTESGTDGPGRPGTSRCGSSPCPAAAGKANATHPTAPPRGLGAELLHSALHGMRPPDRALALLLQRVHADRRVDVPRLALLRLLLNRSPDPQDHLMPQLDKDSTDPAYVCGRIFAVLESVQEAALPDINTTLRDKYFSTAVSAPSLTLRRLFADSTAHFKRLNRDKPGAGRALESRLLELYSKVSDDLPGHLSDVQQGRFIIGYAHQRHEDLAQKRAAADRKKAAVPAQAAPTPDPVSA
nr:type I-C CRISPR-associated protein Cas8c/Csd1 [Streptomyces anulatus]